MQEFAHAKRKMQREEEEEMSIVESVSKQIYPEREKEMISLHRREDV